MEDNATLKTLKASDIANMPCDIYKCAATRWQWCSGSIALWLRYCREYFNEIVYEMRNLPYDSDEQKEFKSKRIPAATLSCTCGKKARGKDNVEHVNPIIVIDIDYKPDKNENVFLADPVEKKKLMNRLIKNGYVYACGSSCRGTGIWAIVALASTEIELHFNALIDDFAAQNIILDPSCRDVTRLRLASPDDIIITPYEYLYCYEKKKQRVWETPKPKMQSRMNEFVLSYSMNQRTVPEIIDSLLALGFRADTYGGWIQAVFHLMPFGDEGFDCFVKISQASGNFKGVDDCRKKWTQNLAPNSRSKSPEECYEYWMNKLRIFERMRRKQNLTS